MTLMEQFANPELFGNLTMGQKMAASGVTLLMGMGITFLILILLWIFISIMGKCMGTTGGKKKEAAPAAAAPAAAPAAEPAKSDDSLVAVIAAAVAAYTGANANNLVVKKITRLSGAQTPWGASGIEDRMDTRKF